MKVKVYNVGCGDCIRIEYVGASGKSRNLMVDGGFERSYRDILSSEFRQLQQEGMQVDLWAISHIHDDHIGGAIGYLGAVMAGRQKDIVSTWWYNPPRTNFEPAYSYQPSQAKSIAQGGKLSSYLQSIGKHPLDSFHNASEQYALDGLTVDILSPDITTLSELAEKYSDAKISLERIEEDETNQAKSSKMRDYHVPSAAFDFSKWKQDTNLENAGSIVMLVTLNGRTLLFLADAHPSVVVYSLSSRGFSRQNKLSCDLVKVSHHGSLANNSSDLYSMINCCRFVLTCDGTNRYGLPQKACIVRILTAPGRNYLRKYFFYFSSGDIPLKSMFDADGEKIFDELNFELVFPHQGAHLLFDTDLF